MTKQEFNRLVEASKQQHGAAAARGELQFNGFLAWLLPQIGVEFDEECLKSLEERPPPTVVAAKSEVKTIPSLPCWYSQVDQTLVTRKLSNGRYFSGAVGHEGKVYCCPWDAEAFMIYDPEGETITAHDIYQVSPTRYARYSSICSFEGRIYAAPVVARILLIFDPAKQQLSGVDISKVVDPNASHYKFGGICGADGKIFAPPGSGSQMLVFDTKDGHVSGVDVTPIAGGPAEKFGGACACDGKIYAAPVVSDQMLVYDPQSDQLTGVDVTSWATGGSKFVDACSVGSHVYLCPDTAGSLLRFDVASGSFTGYDVRKHTGDIAGKFSGMCATGNMIYLSPKSADCVLAFNTESEIFHAFDLSFLWQAANERFLSICELDGRLYLTGALETHMLVLHHLNPWDDNSVAVDLQSEALSKRKAASLELGISLNYLLHKFLDEALVLGDDAESVTFLELAPRFAYGTSGKGYGHTCPRDGKPNCSIVDALRVSESCCKATHFLSWCWGYSLHTMVNAVQLWAHKHPELPKGASLWICFFCNNQYRILDEKVQTGSDDLEATFKTRLLGIGSALVLLDSCMTPFYITRVWCIFETFMTILHKVPTEVILPAKSKGELLVTIQDDINTVLSAFDAIDVGGARASSPTDELHVKNLIKQTSSFAVVNSKVRDHLTAIVKDVIGDYLSAAPKK